MNRNLHHKKALLVQVKIGKLKLSIELYLCFQVESKNNVQCALEESFVNNLMFQLLKNNAARCWFEVLEANDLIFWITGLRSDWIRSVWAEREEWREEKRARFSVVWMLVRMVEISYACATSDGPCRAAFNLCTELTSVSCSASLSAHFDI